MIEIFNIIFLLVFSLILYSSKLFYNLNEKYIKIKNFSLIDNFSLNLVLIFSVLLVLSFLKLNYLIFIFTLVLINIFFLVRNYLIKKNSISIKSEVVIFYLIFGFVISVDLVANPKLEWDGHVWYFQALNFYENYDFFNLSNIYLSNYPHLGGIIWSFFWEVSFLEYEFFGRISYITLYLISILLLVKNFSKNFIIRLFIFSFFVLITYDRFLFGGYQEYLLFSLIIIIFNLLNKFDLKKINYFQLIIIIFSSNLLIWSKNEGLFYYLIIIFYLLFFQNFKNKVIIILASSILIFLKFYLISLNSTDNVFLINYNIDLYSYEFYKKTLFIIKHTVIAMFKYPVWILFLFLIFIKKFEKKDLSILYFSFSSLLLIAIIYLTSNINEFEWYVTGSLDRIVFNSSGFLMFFIASRIKFYILRNFN